MKYEHNKLLSHLMRRAGFGATPDELKILSAQSYESVVEKLLWPEEAPEIQEDLLHRYDPGFDYASNHHVAASQWIYRMINTKRPLEEKMALFCHELFATGGSKVEVGRAMTFQIEMFRKNSLGDFRILLTELSKDPAMLYWLDNAQSNQISVNENYGRELLELFSMGEGNYQEEDVQSAAKAFTGWTFLRPMISNSGVHQPEFVFLPHYHDYSVKTFLGEKGQFNGEDIIDIIVKQPATAEFVAAKLYEFFVADEPDVDAIKFLADAFTTSGYQMRSVMRQLFMSQFFKDSAFAKVKRPVDVIVSLSRLVGDYVYSPDAPLNDIFPSNGIQHDATEFSQWMGQELLNPPSVEGWHTGMEWIDSGRMVERVNVASSVVGDKDKDGIQKIIAQIAAANCENLGQIIDLCLEILGSVEVSIETKDGLLQFAEANARTDGDEGFGNLITKILQLIVVTPEYQLG